jgi:hypothetical protein
MLKERNQNPVVGDELNLRLFTYNSNHRQSVLGVSKVEIFFLDPSCKTEDNPDGRRLVETVDGEDVEEVDDQLGGHYRISVTLAAPEYVIGDYLDVWHVEFNTEQFGNVTNSFMVLSDLWWADSMPVVYDFSFGLRPNRVRQGERRWVTVDVVPNVPNSGDMKRYYTNLAMASPVKVYMEQLCGECVPKEKDLRVVLDGVSVDHRRGPEGYFFLDASELACGIYNVRFELEFGESKYISDDLQMQIY